MIYLSLAMWWWNKSLRKRLFADRVSANKKLFADTVSANKKLFADSGVPIEKKHVEGGCLLYCGLLYGICK